MENFAFLLLFPIVWPIIAKHIWHKTITYKEMGINILLISIIVSIIFSLGMISTIEDTEIWNGQITSKQRDHGHYTTSYCCAYTTVSCGKGCTTTQCSQTCYTDHYTVSWIAKSTIGNFRLKYLDKTSRSVYTTEDPQIYKNCKIGDPASKENTYTNYVQAVPDSLFNTLTKKTRANS